jgi:hypothetical protein
MLAATAACIGPLFAGLGLREERMRIASFVLVVHVVLILSGCKATGDAAASSAKKAPPITPFPKKSNETVSERWERERREEKWARQNETWKQHWRDNPDVNPQMTEAFADK